MVKRIVGWTLATAMVGTLAAIAASGLISCAGAPGGIKKDAEPQEKTAAESAKPERAEATWGVAVEGLRMSVSVPNSPVLEGMQPEFSVAFQNTVEKGFVLNLGAMFGNGNRQFPTAVKLILTDDAGKESELPFQQPPVSGRVDPYVVSLGAGVSCTLPLRGEEFGLRLTPGKYRVAAVYTGVVPDSVNADRPDIKWMGAWKGMARSSEAVFEVVHGNAAPAHAEAPKSAWGKPVEGLQASIGASVAPTAIARDPQWPITFWNGGEKDLVLNFGDWDGIAHRMFPAVNLILTEASGKRRELQMLCGCVCDGMSIIAPCIVSLRPGSKYTVTTALGDFWCPDDREFHPNQGKFRLTAVYTADGRWCTSIDAKGNEVAVPYPAPINFWKGTVQSNEIRFTVSAEPRPSAASPLSLSVVMANRQPAEAPVILQVNVTNVSAADLAVSRGEWRRARGYRALLTGPDGKERHVGVSGGEWEEESFAQEMFKAGDTAVGWLRLTNFPSETEVGPLPSECMFLPPGGYQLRLDRCFWKDGEEFWIRAVAKFTVVNDATLAEARWTELKNPAAGQEQFARHVLKDTVTPEMRRQFYEDLKNPDPFKSLGRIEWLGGLIHAADPKIEAELAPVVVAALKVYVEHPDPNGILNNLCYALTRFHPEGAGPSLLKVAVGNFDRNCRIFALEALRFYYEDRMAAQLAPLLKSTDVQILLPAARLLAYGGDERAAEALIAAAKRKDACNAAALAWLRKHAAAAQALKEALASDDPEFVCALKKCLSQLPPPRNAAAPPKAAGPAGPAPSRP